MRCHLETPSKNLAWTLRNIWNHDRLSTEFHSSMGQTQSNVRLRKSLSKAPETTQKSRKYETVLCFFFLVYNYTSCGIGRM